MVSIRSDEEDYFVQTPQKTISEILETTKVSFMFLLFYIFQSLYLIPCFKYLKVKLIGGEVFPKVHHSGY